MFNTTDDFFLIFQMSPLVHSVVDILLDRLERAENRDKGFNIYP